MQGGDHPCPGTGLDRSRRRGGRRSPVRHPPRLGLPCLSAPLFCPANASGRPDKMDRKAEPDQRLHRYFLIQLPLVSTYWPAGVLSMAFFPATVSTWVTGILCFSAIRAYSSRRALLIASVTARASPSALTTSR